MFKKTNAMIVLNKIEKALDYISREVNKDSYDIGWAFRG